MIFDMFNEPFPEAGREGSTEKRSLAVPVVWGHLCRHFVYPVAGMQTLVNAVRGTGASNVHHARGPGVGQRPDSNGWPTSPLTPTTT